MCSITLGRVDAKPLTTVRTVHSPIALGGRNRGRLRCACRLVVFLTWAIVTGVATAQDPGKELLVELPHGESMRFCWVPPGEYTRGNLQLTEDSDSDEAPPHRVTLTRGFYLGKYEVTQRQWQAVTGLNPATFQQPGPDRLDRPVESVSWESCQGMINRLSAFSDGEFRLPTEAEWEYACRAGTVTPYHFGDVEENWEIRPHAWANSFSSATPHPVGSKPPNGWGLHDMHGSVWEWCSDWFARYEPGPQTDPTGPIEGRDRVFRGGSWFDFPGAHRSANRHRHPTDRRYAAIGLRLVYEPDGQSLGLDPRFPPPAGRRVMLPGGVPLTLLEVPAGSFRMGSPDSEAGRQRDEGPEHEVTITKPLMMAEYETTQEQWNALMDHNPSAFLGGANGANLPVERVTWHEASEYVRRLNEFTDGGFRLPTEAEWEHACRAGATGPWPWQENPWYGQLAKRAWFNPRSEGRSRAVGQKRPNAWGFYDLRGSCWEWCADWMGPYRGESQVDPVGPAEGTHKVIRGGSWFNEPTALRNANRHRHKPEVGLTNLGFRVVWQAP